jgi:hypothetical protein
MWGMAAAQASEGAAHARIPFVLADIYYRQVNDRGYLIEQRGQSNLLAHLLDDLGGGSQEGGSPTAAEAAAAEAAGSLAGEPSSPSPSASAALYVGHDTQLDGLAVLLNLTWAAPPYPTDVTAPGSMLRLTVSGEGEEAMVQADYLYTTFETTGGQMHVATTRFKGGELEGGFKGGELEGGASTSSTSSTSSASSGGGSNRMPWRAFMQAVRASIDWRCVRNATGLTGGTGARG